MEHPLVVIGAIAAVALLYVVLPVAVGGVARFRRGVHVVCPETGQPLDVNVTTLSSAAWSFRGTGSLRVAICPRWPERQSCDQNCVSRT